MPDFCTAVSHTSICFNMSLSSFIDVTVWSPKPRKTVETHLSLHIPTHLLRCSGSSTCTQISFFIVQTSGDFFEASEPSKKQKIPPRFHRPVQNSRWLTLSYSERRILLEWKQLEWRARLISLSPGRGGNWAWVIFFFYKREKLEAQASLWH